MQSACTVCRSIGANDLGKGYRGSACSNCHMSPLPMECRASPTFGIWVNWSGACGPLVQGLLHRSGEVIIRSSATGLPLFQPAISMSAGMVWARTLVRPQPLSTLTFRWVQRQRLNISSCGGSPHLPHACRSQHGDQEDQKQYRHMD